MNTLNTAPQKLIILDFTDGQVYILDYNYSTLPPPEDYVSGSVEDNCLGLNINNCEYMVRESKGFSILLDYP